MRPSLAALSGLVLTLGLGACAVGPDYRKPTADGLPGTFHAAAAVQARQAAPADLAAWWRGFGDPELSRLIGIAGAANLDIAAAQARIGQARAALRAANADLAPSGAVDASAARAKQSLETPLGQVLAATPGFDRLGDLYEGDLSVGWELDLFGGLRRQREAAVADYQAARADALAVTLSVQAQTAETYVAIRELQARLAVAREQAHTQRRLTGTIQLQFAAGAAAERQLHEAEGAQAQVEATVPELESSLETAMNALDVLLGRQPGTARSELAAEAPVPAPPGIVAADGPAGLLRRRPDLIAAERRLAATNAQIGQAVAEYYPQLSLSALAGTATTIAGHQFTGPASQNQAVLGLRWRLFDFGHIDADIAAARGRHAEALAGYRLAVLRATGEVEDSFTALVKREGQERILADGENALAKAAAESRAAYASGVVSLIEVLDADTRLLATRDARVQAQAGAARAAIDSFRALGGGWDAPAAAEPHGGDRLADRGMPH